MESRLMTNESNCITNVSHNLTKRAGVGGADLGNARH